MKKIAQVTFYLTFTLLICLQACKNEEAKISDNNVEIQQPSTQSTVPIAGLQEDSLNLDKYKKIWYVGSTEDNRPGNGTKINPFKTIKEAIDKSTSENGQKEAILVSAGDYIVDEIKLKEGMALFGGFDSNWNRNINKFKTNLISPKDDQRLLIAADNTLIDGFIISNTRFRGKGAAVYCNGITMTISNNIFKNNKTLKPIEWKPEYWHETANDGAAIYGKNKASLIVKNNIFIGNKTENGRGAALAVDNHCNVIIERNIFANNTTGIDDNMRSSDGGAVSIFRCCKGRIADNIFIENKALASNDAGALFIALWSSANVNGNIFVASYADDDAGALFVGGQEHRYDSPLDPIPPADKFFVDITNNTFMGNRNSSLNSGAMRFTMESRGKFEKNTTVFNNGIYFQRSEVAVKDNIIMDNFLFVETKANLLPGEITNNLIWADFNLDVNPVLSDNIIKGYKNENGIAFNAPEFKNDGYCIRPVSLNFDKGLFQTDILVSDKIPNKNLVNRIIRSGNKWGVINSQDDNELIVWGDFSGCDSFEILPTYQQIK